MYLYNLPVPEVYDSCLFKEKIFGFCCVILYMYTDWDALELEKDIIFAEWNESDVPKNDPVSNNKNSNNTVEKCGV